jgi:hypothetical protein
LPYRWILQTGICEHGFVDQYRAILHVKFHRQTIDDIIANVTVHCRGKKCCRITVIDSGSGAGNRRSCVQDQKHENVALISCGHSCLECLNEEFILKSIHLDSNVGIGRHVSVNESLRAAIELDFLMRPQTEMNLFLSRCRGHTQANQQQTYHEKNRQLFVHCIAPCKLIITKNGKRHRR